ncbi:hypothetical protein KJ742_07785 [Patescibacteria group bacterium]|nr:hypothetical protein [Patescibacteria group bacterium]MBU1683812.1 hypothetical protein [Patescibacteria group bacterium]
MINIIKNNRGVSLPLVIGLVMLLMIASVGVNELILRTLRSAHQIEAADRAYFAAEAGIEDALYELTPHFAGYETPDLDSADVRSNNFGGSVQWDNNWAIESISDSDTFDGYFYSKQKLIISLYNDEAGDTVKAANFINTDPADISTLGVGSFLMTFRVPYDQEDQYSTPFLNNGLVIDNDSDGRINEDGPENNGSCPGVVGTSRDADCDRREDEDSNQDPVIYWKIIDDEGRYLEPKTGCFTGVGTPEDPQGSEMCEKDFINTGTDIYIELNDSDLGVNQDGDEVSIGTFITNGYDNRSTKSKLQIEFQIVAPLEQAYEDNGVKEIIIPYLEYTVETGSDYVPLPRFTIKSDGYYKDFKQSITTTITPKTIAPLFDFTIIQQQ